MKREEILSKIEAIQDKNYNEFSGSNEAELHIREDVADLIEDIMQASGVSSKNEPCGLAGVSTRYKMIDIQLHDWLCIAITDNETKNAVCHFTTDGEIEGVIDMAKKITNILNGW